MCRRECRLEGDRVVETGVVQDGIYAGQTVKKFNSPLEAYAAYEEGQLGDGELYGFEESLYPWFQEGSSYAFGIGTDIASISLAEPVSPTRVISFHELPDPGWVINNVDGTVTSPDGVVYETVFALPVIILFLIKIIAVVLAAVVISLAITMVIGAFKGMTVSTSQQISDTLALISHADGSSTTVNKETNEIVATSDAPWFSSGDMTWVILAVVAIGGVFMIMELLKTGKSTPMYAMGATARRWDPWYRRD